MDFTKKSNETLVSNVDETVPFEDEDFDVAVSKKILDGDSFILRGAPGSGKTTFLVGVLKSVLTDFVLVKSVEQIDLSGGEGYPWSPIVLLTPDRRRATDLETLAGPAVLGAVNTPGGHRLIRSINSYAYLIVSQWLVEREIPLPKPKLAGGADEDVWFSLWLQKNKDSWGEILPEAVVQTSSFRMEMRNLLARVGEAGISPDELRSLAETNQLPLWGVAADAYEDYAGNGSKVFSEFSSHIDAARIQIIAAGVLDRWQTEYVKQSVYSPMPIPKIVLVDDLQDFTPATAVLLSTMSQLGVQIIATSCSEEATATFRGGDPGLASKLQESLGLEAVDVSKSFRFEQPIERLVGTISEWITPKGRLPDTGDSETSTDQGNNLVPVRVFSSDGRKGSYLADSLRRNHYLKGIPWEQQAIIVRAADEIEPLRRQLQRKGVPLAPSRRAFRLADIPVCAALLRLLDMNDFFESDMASTPSQENENAFALLGSPLCGIDRLNLFRLLRRLEIFRSDDFKGSEEPEPLFQLEETEEKIVTELQELSSTATGGDDGISLVFWLENPQLLEEISNKHKLGSDADLLVKAGQLWKSRVSAAKKTPQMGLWQLWDQADLADLWREQSIRGGWDGEQADERLDAVMALFRKADLWEQQQLFHDSVAIPTASQFAEEVLVETVVSDSIATVGLREPGVEIVTVSQAAGRQWEIVYISGPQEGRWPAIARAGSILDLPRMENLLSHDRSDWQNPIPLDLRAYRQERRRNEARLLVSASSRAISEIEFVAVEDEDQAVSQFLNHLGRQEAVSAFRNEDGQILLVEGHPSFDLPHLVGQLRQQSIDSTVSEESRQEAADLLAVMAVEGVSLADPKTWTGAGGLSSDSLILSPEDLKLNPSSLQMAKDCLLKWFFASTQGDDRRGVMEKVPPDAAVVGTLVHKLAEDNPNGTAEELLEKFHDEWQRMGFEEDTWWSQKNKTSIEKMVQAMGTYFQRKHAKVETEVPFVIKAGESSISGRIDRLEYDDEEIVHIVDIKTGKNAPTKAQVEENLQLSMYQLSMVEQGKTIKGASLLTVAAPSRGNVLRTQSPLSDEEREALQGDLQSLAATMLGPEYVPTISNQCSFCNFKSICPAQDLGIRGIE